VQIQRRWLRIVISLAKKRLINKGCTIEISFSLQDKIALFFADL
jgi:hypothetical protein